MYKEILDKFLSVSDSYLSNITTSLQTKDIPAAARFAHSLAGAAGNISAVRLCMAARKLEEALDGDRTEKAWKLLETTGRELNMATRAMHNHLEHDTEDKES